MASELPHANSFRELLAYRKSRKLAKEIFILSKQFPKDEMYALTDQIRRSSRSIGGQIAEAWAKRRYERHFVSKLTDADGEQLETQHWIGVAFDCEYWDRTAAEPLKSQCQEIGRLLNGMIEKSATFCLQDYHSLHDPPADYFVDDTTDY